MRLLPLLESTKLQRVRCEPSLQARQVVIGRSLGQRLPVAIRWQSSDLRAQARERKGWIMDTYLLRRRARESAE